jgi:hypothetical protein
VRDQVDEHAQERQHDHEEPPSPPYPSRNVVAAEDVMRTRTRTQIQATQQKKITMVQKTSMKG